MLRYSGDNRLSNAISLYLVRHFAMQNATTGRRRAMPSRFVLETLNRGRMPDIIKTQSTTKLQQQIRSQSFNDLGLRPEVVKAVQSLVDEAVKPSMVQSLAIPEILKGSNVFCAAETGSGKTVAYLAPLISMLRQEEVVDGVLRLNQRPRVVILVPSKELVSQVTSVAKSLSHISKVRVEGIFDRKPKRRSDFRGLIDIVISTPQKFLYQLDKGVFQTTDIRHVVIDEADTMLEKDFGEHTRKVLAAVKNKDSKVDAQMILVSATLPKSISATLQKEFPKKLVHVVTPKVHRTSSRLKQRFITLSGHGDNKQMALVRLLLELPPKDHPTIVFCNRLGTVNSLNSWISGVKEAKEVSGGEEAIVALHSRLDVKERQEIIKKFKSGEVKVMICTDMASRGLDTTNARHVILFDFPKTVVDYLHRVGRTARAGGDGRATSLIGKADAELAKFIQKRVQGRTNSTLEGVNK